MMNTKFDEVMAKLDRLLMMYDSRTTQSTPQSTTTNDRSANDSVVGVTEESQKQIQQQTALRANPAELERRLTAEIGNNHFSRNLKCDVKLEFPKSEVSSTIAPKMFDESPKKGKLEFVIESELKDKIGEKHDKSEYEVVGEAYAVHSTIETEVFVGCKIEAKSKIGTDIKLIDEFDIGLEVALEEKVNIEFIMFDSSHDWGEDYQEQLGLDWKKDQAMEPGTFVSPPAVDIVKNLDSPSIVANGGDVSSRVSMVYSEVQNNRLDHALSFPSVIKNSFSVVDGPARSAVGNPDEIAKLFPCLFGQPSAVLVPGDGKGRAASHITLECALQSHPSITLIGEEVACKKESLKNVNVTDYIADVVCKRAESGDNYGVILVPEGLIGFIPEVQHFIEKLNEILASGIVDEGDLWKKKLPIQPLELFEILPSTIQDQLMLERDPHGNVQVAKIETEKMLIQMVETELEQRSQTGSYKGQFKGQSHLHFFGYKGRCSLPSIFNATYCYVLGYGTKVRIWSIPGQQVVVWTDLHEMATAACYTSDGQAALVDSYKGSCRLYNTFENKMQQKTEINLQNKKKKSRHKNITGFQFAPGSTSGVQDLLLWVVTPLSLGNNVHQVFDEVTDPLLGSEIDECVSIDDVDGTTNESDVKKGKEIDLEKLEHVLPLLQSDDIKEGSLRSSLESEMSVELLEKFILRVVEAPHTSGADVISYLCKDQKDKFPHQSSFIMLISSPCRENSNVHLALEVCVLIFDPGGGTFDSLLLATYPNLLRFSAAYSVVKQYFVDVDTVPQKVIVHKTSPRGIHFRSDGTQRGASVINEEIRRRGLKVVVAGISKSIDNDIPVINKSFGFDTAIEEAQRDINAAHVEAGSTENGIGRVKLMGCYSGFIAMYTTLASRAVDLCVISESPFYLEGEGVLFEYVEKLLKDVGMWVSHRIKDHFATHKMGITLKYIDPTYMICAVPETHLFPSRKKSQDVKIGTEH